MAKDRQVFVIIMTNSEGQSVLHSKGYVKPSFALKKVNRLLKQKKNLDIRIQTIKIPKKAKK